MGWTLLQIFISKDFDIHEKRSLILEILNHKTDPNSSIDLLYPTTIDIATGETIGGNI